MSEEEWWGFPRMPGWKYEWDVRLGAETEIRPFGPHCQIRVECRSVEAPCEVRSVRWKDFSALREAFAEAFADIAATSTAQRNSFFGLEAPYYGSFSRGGKTASAARLLVLP